MADKGTTELPTVTDTVLVNGEVESVGEEALDLYFTNKKRCGGGEICSIVLKIIRLP